MARKGLNEEFQFHRDIFDFIDKLDGQLSLVNLNCHRPAPKKKKKIGKDEQSAKFYFED